MKKVLFILIAVLFCSINVNGQSSRIVAMGAVVEKKSYDEGVSYLKQHVPLEVFPSGEYGCILDSPSLMLVLKRAPQNKIKEVSFMCGFAMYYGIDKNLKDNGYVLKSSDKVQLGNGVYVPQDTYVKGNTKCFVQTIDDDYKQIIFRKE